MDIHAIISKKLRTIIILFANNTREIMPQSEPQQPDIESKGQRKRDMLALQKIGESLLKLSDAKLAALELPENLLAAIQHAKSLTSNEARRRQLQYIGKIMREVDVEPIKLALGRMQLTHQKSNTQFHHTEQWREKLISEGDDALNAFIQEHPKADRQQLRQLIRNAQRDRKNQKNSGAEKALFRFLHDIVKE